MSGTYKRLGQSELLPRYVFAEALIARRRVLELGAVASTGGESAVFLLGRGARQVVSADADLAAVESASARHGAPGLRFRAPVFDDVESGSFDVILVADLAPYVRAPENLRELRRLLGPGGTLVGGLRNPAGLALASILDPEEGDAPPTYGQLFDALSGHFASVEVATQSPVLGYQLAFDRGEGLQVDGSLAGASEAAYYVVLAGGEPVRSFDPTWVQLPPEPLAFNGARLEEASQRAREWRERSEALKDALGRRSGELDERQGVLREAQAQLEQAREAVCRLTAQLETAREAPESLRDRDDLARRVQALEVELALQRQRSTDAEARVARARADQEALEAARRDATVTALAAQEQARLERARREELASQLEDARGRLADGHAQALEATREAGLARAAWGTAAAEVAALQEGIAARDRQVEEALERELTLADQRTLALTALEGLQGRLEQASQELAQARALAEAREADRLSAVRALEAASEGRQEQLRRLEGAEAEAAGLAAELARRGDQVMALETELQATAAAHQRVVRDVETLASSERHWRELASQYEERLAGATQDIDQLNDQLAQLEGSRVAEVARARRLELDLGTALTAGRTTQEQAEAGLAEARSGAAALAAQLEALTRSGEEQAAAAGERELVLRGELEAERAAAAATATALERATQRLLEADALHQERLESVRASHQAASERLASTTAEVVRLTAIESRLGPLEQELASLRAQHAAAAEQEEARAGELAAGREAATAAEGALQAAETARLAAVDAEQRSRAVLAELEERHGRALEQLAHANAELVHLARSIEVQGAGLEAHGRQALELDARLQLLDQEKRRLAESLASAMSEAEHLSAALQESQAAREAELAAADAGRARAALDEAEAERLRREQAREHAAQAQGRLAEREAAAAALAAAQRRAEALEAELGEARRLARAEPPRDPELGRLRARNERLEAVAAQHAALQDRLAAQGALVMQLQSELDARQGHLVELETALAEVRASRDAAAELAASSAMEAVAAAAQERAALAEVELSTLQARLGALEQELAEALAPQARREEDLRVARRRLAQAEAELELTRGRALGDLAAERGARDQAESLLLSLRSSYGDLQHQATATAEALAEALAERDLLALERQRLAAELEDLPRQRAELSRLRLEASGRRRELGGRVATAVTPPAPVADPEVFELEVEVTSGLEAEELLWSDEDEPGPGRR